MKEKLFTFIVKSTFFVFRFIPHIMIVFMGRILGFILRFFLRFKMDRVKENLGIVYGAKENWPKGIVGKIYRHFGTLLVEMLKLPSINGEAFNKRFHVSGAENLDKALAQEKGVIIVTGHTGNWEYGIAGLNSYGYPMNVIVKKLKSIDNDYLFQKLRGDKGVGFILKEKAVLNIRRALKKNKVVVMVIDQNSKRSEGTFVEHFGKLASTYAAPYVLSNRFKCPVIPCFCYRDENFYDHHIEVYPEVQNEVVEGEEEENVRVNIRNYIKTFEDFLLKHPEQWIWMHRRWRSQPREPENSQ